MSDDPTNPDKEPTYSEDQPAPEDPEAGHDDIMKRLVDYQRQLRQGVEPTEAAAIAWHREPRDPGQTEPPEQHEEPEPADQPEPHEQPSHPEELPTFSEERDVVDVSSPEPELPLEAEVEPAVRDKVGTFDQPSDRVEILTTDEAEATLARPWERPSVPGREATRTDVSARITQLEGTLDRLSKLLGDLRENFQGMAVTADERLAALEAEIERNRDRPDDSP